MAESFYPFTQNGGETTKELEVKYPARIAIFDDIAAAPRVLTIDVKPIREYLEEITATVSKLAKEQGGKIPFMVIRECVENLIHAYFISPTISILDNGNTIKFSDQGPGIQNINSALEYGTTSATEEMKQYIRGVGSGLPYAMEYMREKGGSLEIQNNIHNGCVVTLSLISKHKDGKPYIGIKETNIINYLHEHELVGPKELVDLYGSSAATWSRILKQMEKSGLLVKRTQKYQLK